MHLVSLQHRPLRTTFYLSAIVLTALVAAGCKDNKTTGGESTSGSSSLATADKAEAMILLKIIGDGALMASGRMNHDPATNTVSLNGFPLAATEVCTSTGGTAKQVEPNAADYKKAPWKDMYFSISKPHVFKYCYQSDGKSFRATATSGEHKLQIQGSMKTEDGAKIPTISEIEEIPAPAK